MSLALKRELWVLIEARKAALTRGSLPSFKIVRKPDPFLREVVFQI